MKAVKCVIYRYLTNADFFNINKPLGTEDRGGGQSYIDFPTTHVSKASWKEFFSGVHGVVVSSRAKGSAWECPIYSLGISGAGYPQKVTIYQRRPNSISIGAQKITSSKGNRVNAWHPSCGFPEPKKPANRTELPDGLVIYLVKTVDNEIWAGWFINAPGNPAPTASPAAAALLAPMLGAGKIEGDSGVIQLDEENLQIDPSESQTPFFADVDGTSGSTAKPATVKPVGEENKSPKTNAATSTKKAKHPIRKVRTEAEILASLFEEDDVSGDVGEGEAKKTVIVRKRNQKAVRDLKELYGHVCQITGNKYTFKKVDGNNYVEGHHLIPLGAGGADDPRNIVLLSPLIHRMLHYAKVSPIDLADIKTHEDGTSYLDITINDEGYRIRWHPEHAKMVRNQDKT